jgi:predicted phage baseplate assembly protein
VAQVLGAGDASQPFQRFELKQAPLTFRSAPSESGAASELTVRVADVEWTERSTLYGAGSERAYTLQLDEQGKRWVQFGDGTRGARLPSGVNNVRATYRKGIGVDGNVRADTLTQLAARPLGLKSVANLVAAAGGTDPEPASAARSTMPLMTRTLGRAVSLLDYEDFARAYAGVAKAQAAVLLLVSGPTVTVTVAGPDNALLSAANPVWRNLLDALTTSGDPYVPVRLLTHQASTFRLGLKVKCDPAYEAKRVLADVEVALRAHYAFEARELGQPVQQSEVIAVVHQVPGVVAVDLDSLYGGTAPPAQTVASRRVRLLASRMRVAGGVPLPAEILTLDPRPLDRLEAMP